MINLCGINGATLIACRGDRFADKPQPRLRFRPRRYDIKDRKERNGQTTTSARSADLEGRAHPQAAASSWPEEAEREAREEV